MGYQKAIEKYKEIYRQISLEEILSLWEANKKGISIYVHSPFCATICKFCIYKGIKFNLNDDAVLYDQYYNDYLPKAIKPFLPIIEKQEIETYFFGGGTPSLMKPETMVSIFNLFPGFKEVKSKAFEIHPAIYTDEQLDVLAEYGFNCCIIGIQSFNKDVLDRQNRLYASPDEVFSLTQKIRDRGIYVSGDIIYGMEPIDADEIFKQDLHLLERMDFDIATLQSNFKKREILLEFYEHIRNSEISKNRYWDNSPSPENIIPDANNSGSMKAIRYVKNNIPERLLYEIFKFCNSSEEISKKNINEYDISFSVMGFGSYQNPTRNTFSHVVDKVNPVEYIEINNNWSPEYYMTYENNREKNFKQYINNSKKIKLLGEPPEGVSIQIKKSFSKKDANIFRYRKNQDIFHMVLWKQRNKKIDSYLNALKKAFPEINIDLNKTSSFVEI